MAASSEVGSVTEWLEQLAGDRNTLAQHHLFHRYFRQLVSLARDRLRHPSPLSRDAEDVALSAMDSFFGRLEKGDFAQLGQRSELWALLVTITTCKAINQAHRQRTARRGRGREYCESDVPDECTAEHTSILQAIASKEPTPAMVIQLAEECRCRLDSLPDNRLRMTARLKLEGYTNSEIARILGVSPRTVGRKLCRIRREWLEADVS
jgi:DNA-directed RNA polymerase specialized sigma24 family protein